MQQISQTAVVARCTDLLILYPMRLHNADAAPLRVATPETVIDRTAVMRGRAVI